MRLILLMRHYHFSIEEIRLIVVNFTSDEMDLTIIEESKEFFSQKIDDLRDLIRNYRGLIRLIEGLPIMNDFDDLEVKAAETKVLIDQLYGEVR